MTQRKYASQYDQLKNKWLDRETKSHKRLWERHQEALQWLLHQTRHIGTSSAAGFLLLTGIPSLHPLALPRIAHITPSPSPAPTPEIEGRAFLVSDLYGKLPTDVAPLTHDQQGRVSAILSARFGIGVKSQLDGKELNTNYGLIGQEQHLSRFPGDMIESHFSNNEELDRYASYGMAPGLGAYGYFASSKTAMTPQDNLREKYYVAVQTWLSPGYTSDIKGYSEFFMYRKVLVVNPQNGRAIVADIADAGPSEWTGKQYGGSPEVMQYLDRRDGSEKGPVVCFFIDDPDNSVPLGPITTQSRI